MTNPKMKPCPQCGSADSLAVFSYDNGTRHVECDNRKCLYLGPGAGSIRAAIKAHNAKMVEWPHWSGWGGEARDD